LAVPSRLLIVGAIGSPQWNKRYGSRRLSEPLHAARFTRRRGV